MADNIEVYPFRRTRKETGGKQKRERARGTQGKKRKKKGGGLTGALKTSGALFFPAQPAETTPRAGQGIKANRLLFALSEQLLFAATGFFLARAVLLAELTPFAPAYAAAAARVFPASRVPVLLGVLSGIFTGGQNIWLNALTVFLSLLFSHRLPENVKNPWLLLSGLVFAVIVITKTGFLAFTSSLPYDYIAVLFEAVIAGVGTLIFFYALPAFRKLDGVQNLNAEELFCVFIFLTAVVAGTGDLKLWEISLQGFLSRLIILTAALLGGMGQGAAAGALLGFIPGLAYTGAPALIGAYSFAGLLAGTGRPLGKSGVVMGFLLGNILLSVYLQNFGDLVTVLVETGLASGVFFTLPAGYVQKISASLAVFNVVPKDSKKMQTAVTGRMRKWAHIFRELAHGYAAAGAPSPGYRELALQNLFNAIGQKVCNGCSLYRTCWEREFYRTYQSFLDMFTLVEIYGQVTAEDLPEMFKRRCTRVKELAITITCLYDTYKLNRYWRRRFQESKEIFSEQLKSVSEVIEGLTQQFQAELETSAQKEVFLKEKLKQAGVPAVEVKIFPQENGRKEIFLRRQACADRQDCFIRVAPLLSRLLEETLAPPFPDCPGVKEGLCSVRLYPELKYQVRVGVAKIGKEGNPVSGDSYTLIPLRRGKFALALSDGMGAGPPAAVQSGTAVTLLEHLLESGIAVELAIKTVNSLMLLRSGGDNFATIDLVLLDLYSGEAEFIKIGAPPSLLARGRRISLVSATSLPAGILKEIDVTSVTKKLLKKDLLVMFSDGLLDTYHGPRDKEEWVKEVLQGALGLAPQEIADLFLQLVQTGAGTKAGITDDITVMVARLEERAV